MSSTDEFWLISVPGEKTPQESWDKVSKSVNHLAGVFKFNIPNLKVGTLDQLFSLSDELNKIDSFVEGVTHKVAQYFSEILEHKKDMLAENIMANNVDCLTYVTKFDWDYAKYPIKQPLKAIADSISKQVSLIENDLKSKATAYNAIKQSLQALHKKQTGSLLSRNIGDIVKKEDFVLDSEYLTTVLVILSKNQMEEWFANYESLCEYIVPRSSKKLFEDGDQVLVSVTMFQKVVDTFKVKCRDRKYLVRDFKFDEQAIAKDNDQIKTLEQNKKDKFGPLVRWLKINFSESFTAWIHIKALRIFVESVLRYGLPVNFQAILLKPPKKTGKRLRETLDSLYSHLNTTADLKKNELSSALEIPGLMGTTADFYSYVFFSMNLDFVENNRY